MRRVLGEGDESEEWARDRVKLSLCRRDDISCESQWASVMIERNDGSSGVISANVQVVESWNARSL